MIRYMMSGVDGRIEFIVGFVAALAYIHREYKDQAGGYMPVLRRIDEDRFGFYPSRESDALLGEMSRDDKRDAESAKRRVGGTFGS